MIERTFEQLAEIYLGRELGFFTHEEIAQVTDWNAQVKVWRDALNAPPPELPLKELRIQKRVIELEIVDYSKGSWTPHQVHRLRQAERALPLMDARIAKALDEIANPQPAIKPPDRPPPFPSRIQSVLDLLTKIGIAESRLSLGRAHFLQTAREALGAADIELCLRWANISVPQDFSSAALFLDLLVKSEGSYRTRQLLSARTAEHIAAQYFMQIGHAVIDISVLQNQGSSQDWKIFDLRVNTRPVDVKNARQSFNGNGNYVEHCVPNFKQERTSSSVVNVLGIVSEYVVDFNSYLKAGTEGLVLGEVNELDIRELISWASARFGSALDLRAILRNRLIPGWLFEYASEHYFQRIKEISAITPIILSCLDAQIPADAIPGWLLILCPDQSLIDRLPLTPDRRRMVAELRTVDISIGLTRRSLLVYAMGITLESLVNFVDPTEKLNQFRDLILCRVSSRTNKSILGLHDPLRYVISMVANLTRIGYELTTGKFQITGFKLIHPAILLGTDASGSSVTLLAYCGGWMTFPIRASCGTTPLVIGNNQSCDCCQHLICKNCGHCSTGCVQCGDRQEQVASAHKQLATQKNDGSELSQAIRSTRIRDQIDWSSIPDED